MFNRFLAAAVLCLLTLQATGQSPADTNSPVSERPLLYAGHFVCQAEQPATRTETFQLPEDSTGPYVLRVINGAPEGGQRARSVTILLNGTEVVSAGRLDAKTDSLWIPVTRQLREQNILTVTVKGKTGAEIFITLEDLDAVARAFTPHSGATASTSGGLH